MSISLVLFDRLAEREELLPLVATRPVGNLRVGAFTLDQKWSVILGTSYVSYLTEDYLSSKFPLKVATEEVLVIKATVLPNSNILKAIQSLDLNQRLVDKEGKWIACKTNAQTKPKILEDLHSKKFTVIKYTQEYQSLRFLEDIFSYNADQIVFDYPYISSEPFFMPKSSVTIVGEHFKISHSAKLAKCTLNSTSGPILVLDNAIIEPDCVIHGPAVIGKNVRVKSGAVIYPNVTLGDNSVVCGELNNAVIWGNSAKGHYGYLGCAVVGEGCNLGAGTSNSNLKNDWDTVKVYSYKDNNFRNTGLLKCGVFIGDQCMLAISSKINTGTVIGVGAQVAISNFIPKFVPDFSWLSDGKSESYILTKFVEMISRKAQVKKEDFTPEDKEILEYIYKQTLRLRNF
jgi:UDP-N-acetylglucosamine diphosphorylase/glucosamine-1-phosphate N-acetyltransferase